VSPHARLQTAMAHTSQPRREAGLLLTLAASGLEPCSLSSTPSPKDRVFAGACAEASTEPFGAVHPLSAFVAVLDGQRTQRSVCCLVATASLYSHPSGECFHRAPILPYFPCSPSVTRLGAYPAPCGNCAALLLRLSENLFDKAPHKTRTKRFSEPSAKALLGTWERGTSRRFAQECPEGNPGKYKQEK
jgi:hypothetical protein